MTLLRTFTLDVCVLPLTVDMVLKHGLSITKIMEDTNASVTTRGDEVKAWKELFCVATERCRTWTHQAGCDYITKGVPVSYITGVSPLCECGRGKGSKGFDKVELRKPFAKYVTRAAIPLLYSAAFLERNTEGGLKETMKRAGHKAADLEIGGNKGENGGLGTKRGRGIGGGFTPRDKDTSSSSSADPIFWGELLRGIQRGLPVETIVEAVKGGKEKLRSLLPHLRDEELESIMTGVSRGNHGGVESFGKMDPSNVEKARSKMGSFAGDTGEATRSNKMTIASSLAKKNMAVVDDSGESARTLNGAGKTEVCGGCGTLAAKTRCSRCKRVYYCSANCQKTDWKTHKKVCVLTEGV